MQRGDFEGLLLALREHPEWRGELRREILTEEVLALPAAVADLVAAQRRTEARLGELASAQTELASAQARTEAKLGTLIEQVSRMADEVGWLRGKVLEMDHRDRAYSYFQRVARRIRVLDPQALDDLFDEAMERGQLSEADCDELRRADTIARGRQDGERVYLVVESSFGVGIGDVQRARRRADLLARTGVRTIPVAAGSWISHDAAETAAGMLVWYVTERDGTVATAA